MWPQWLRSPSRGRTPPPLLKPSHSPRYFSCSSFKDIHAVLSEQNGSIFEPRESPKKPSIFHRVRLATSLLRSYRHPKKFIILSLPPNIDNHHIIIYFTSLRIIRKTYEDCKTIRSILRGYRVPIDERDLSMDEKYLDEIHKITGSKRVNLPLVFIGGNYIGGAEEIKEMNESGDLKKLIGVLPFIDNNSCDLCGGLRFVVCEQCNGSHKIYSEKHGFRSCTTCNVNGLIRCPMCSPVYRRRLST